MSGEAEYELLRLYVPYTRLVLPLSGGLLEQPNRFSEAMAVIENQLAQKDDDE